MDITLLGLYIINYLVYFSLYPIYGVVASIIIELCNVNKKSYAYIIILSLIQIPSSFILTRLADKTKHHRLLIILSLMLYIFSISLEIHLQKLFPTTGITFRLLTLIIFSFLGLGGLMPILDVLILNRLSYMEKIEEYGKIRIVGGLGKFSAYFVLAVSFISKNRINNIYISMLIFISVVIFMILVVPEYKTINYKNDRQNTENKISIKQEINIKDKSTKEVTTSFKYALLSLLNLKFIILCVITFLIGVQRNSSGHYVPVYLSKLNIYQSHINRYYAFQMLIEVIALCLNPFLDKLMGLQWILLLSSILSLVRVFIYGFYHFKYPNDNISKLLIMIAEGTKGFYTGTMSFSSSLLVYDCSNENNKALAQGILYIFHYVFSEVLSGVSGISILKDSDSVSDLKQYFRTIFYIGTPLFILPIVFIMTSKKQNKTQ